MSSSGDDKGEVERKEGHSSPTPTSPSPSSDDTTTASSSDADTEDGGDGGTSGKDKGDGDVGKDDITYMDIRSPVVMEDDEEYDDALFWRILELPSVEKEKLFTLSRLFMAGEDVSHLLSSKQKKAIQSNYRNLARLGRELALKANKDLILGDFSWEAMRIIDDIQSGKKSLNQGLVDMCMPASTDVRAMRLLIKFFADVNYKYHYGWTPLCLTAMKGEDAAVELLIEHGAQVNLADDSGYTPIMYACMNGHASTAILLRRCDSDLTLRNRANNTCIEVAIACGNEHVVQKFKDVYTVLEEAYLRVRRFYIKLMRGEPDHWTKDEEYQSKEYKRGRMLAIILTQKPKWVSKTDKRGLIVPTDLLRPSKLGRKAFGHIDKWTYAVEHFNPRDITACISVSSNCFKGELSARQIRNAVKKGQEIFIEKQRKLEEERERKRKDVEFNKFLNWCRHPDYVHFRFLEGIITQICGRRRMSPFAAMRIEDWMNPEMHIERIDYEAWEEEEVDVIEKLRVIFVRHEAKLMGDSLMRDKLKRFDELKKKNKEFRKARRDSAKLRAISIHDQREAERKALEDLRRKEELERRMRIRPVKA